MNKKIFTYMIRGLFTSGLVYMVYTETGLWTALSIGLITVGTELQFALFKRLQAQIILSNKFTEMFNK